jgi:anti-anti-sigma regulatory factor
VKYHIIEEEGQLLIKIFGNTRKNESLPAKKLLTRYLRKKDIRVIVDLEELNRWEPVTLVGVLNAIRKEVRFSNGDLKLRSLKPDILNYLQVHRLDQMFQYYADEGEETEGRGEKDHDKR